MSPKTIRLARDEFMAVDLCSCGTLQLHIGALSLRLESDAVAGLADLLRLALVKREALLSLPEPDIDAGSSASGWAVGGERRGKA